MALQSESFFRPTGVNKNSSTLNGTIPQYKAITRIETMSQYGRIRTHRLRQLTFWGLAVLHGSSFRSFLLCFSEGSVRVEASWEEGLAGNMNRLCAMEAG